MCEDLSYFHRILDHVADGIVPGSRFEDTARAGAERGEFANAIGREEKWIAERMKTHLDPQGPIEQKLGGGRWPRIEERRTRKGGIVSLRADITALKGAEAAIREIEEKFRDFAESSSDWFWGMDAGLRFTYMSPNVERIIGVTPGWHYGKTRADIPGDEYDRELWDAPLEAERDRKSFRDFTYLRVGKGIEDRWISASGVPVFAKDGVFQGYRGTASDMTGVKRAEEQLQQAQKMEAVGQLTGGVAHDLNNLLTVVLGNLEILLDHVGGSAEARELIKAAIAASERGAGLTQRLLAFSREQALRPESTDTYKLIFGTTELLRRTIGEDIKIETVNSGGLWPAIVDRKQLENAIINLAINARDAMPGGGRLTIVAANADADWAFTDEHGRMARGRYVMIAVSDMGTSMSPEIVERTFDPFFTTKEVGEGSGLGLSMVFGFAKQTDGHAAIYSEVGEGTTVKIYLPIAEGEDRTAPNETQGRQPLPRGDERLLVVEDDAGVRSFLLTALRSAGYAVTEAADGAEAVAQLNHNSSIDLLVTDVVLPGGMNGREVAAAVEVLRPGIRILYTSGYPRCAIASQGKLEDGVELLMKPYTRETLVRRVRAVLDAPRT
jgi:PAS domain S-box-containing protein